MKNQPGPSSSPLGEAQQPRRDAERCVRRRVVALARLAPSAHPTRAATAWKLAAQAVGVKSRTVRHWSGRWRRHELKGVPRGRPGAPLARGVATEVSELLDRTGGGRWLGLPALKASFPHVPRSRLREMQRRWRAEHEATRHSLTWTTPGTVWSVDFTRPSDGHGMGRGGRIDGHFDRILLVRDLASRCTLLALPCSGECAEVVQPTLERLFHEHGAPLVLKSDNGSAFIAGSTGVMLQRHRVTHLRSPALTPQYNGSIESTGGCLKARVAEIAQRQGAGEGRCGWWSSDDIEAARVAGNALNRPWGSSGPTPIECWQGRAPEPISDASREAFRAAVERWRSRIEAERAAAAGAQEGGNAEAGTCEESSGDDRTGGGSGRRASVARAAIRQALIELGFLLVRSTANMSTSSPAVRGKD